jgi:hypothetical protein
MATAAEIADLITAGMQGPTGSNDSGWHVGQILSWSSASGLNSVRVNGATLTNLKALTPSIGTEYAPGQSVLIVRKQTQYFILGPVTTPGAVGSSPPTQIDAGGGVISGTTGTWRDLDGGAGLSTTMSIKLAPFQRVLFMWGAGDVQSFGSEVEASIVVTSVFGGGANKLASPGIAGTTWKCGNQISVSNYSRSTGFKTYFIQTASADATPSDSFLMPGVNNVAIKYRYTIPAGAGGTGSPQSRVGSPWLLVIPF